MGSCEPHPDGGGFDGSVLPKCHRNGESYLSGAKSAGMKPRHNMAAATLEKASQTVPPSTSTTESVKNVAEDLALDIALYKSGVEKRQPSSQYAVTLRRTVDELLHRHEILFDGMVAKLEISQYTLRNVLDEMFKDENYNWGRVVSIYAFGGRMAQHAAEQHKHELIDKIAEWLGEYITQRLSKWIHEAGGWDSFHQYFPEQKSLEERLWQGLLVTAVGLGALATMVAVR